MANALRNLQLFRNGSPIIGTMAAAKSAIESAFAAGTLILNDGEPISIRYQEPNSNDVKGLYGVAYVDPNSAVNNKILWASSDINMLPTGNTDEYINITDNSSGTFTVELNVINSTTGTLTGDALATANYVNEYVTETVKDKFVKSGSVEYLGEDSEHRMPGDEGYVETPGDDPYLVLVLEGGESGTTDDTKIYVSVKDMITEYTSGDGIIIEANGVIGVDVSRIGEIANSVVGNAVANLGSVTAANGNYFTEIRVNAVTGQLEAEEAVLVTDTYVVNGQLRVDGTENKTYIDLRYNTDPSAATAPVSIEVTDLVPPTYADSIVTYNTVTGTLNATQGLFNDAAVNVIKEYVDDFDCGSFTI